MRLLDAGGTRADAHAHVVGNALLSDQEEYLEAGVDQCVQAIYSCFCLFRFEAECTDWVLLVVRPASSRSQSWRRASDICSMSRASACKRNLGYLLRRPRDASPPFLSTLQFSLSRPLVYGCPVCLLRAAVTAALLFLAIYAVLTYTAPRSRARRPPRRRIRFSSFKSPLSHIVSHLCLLCLYITAS